jgi:prolyl 4-hydroxylase
VAYKDGMQPARLVETALDFTAFRNELESLLEVPRPNTELAIKYKQPSAFFTPQGKRLERLSEVSNSVVFFFEGGQFIWPGIKIGHKSAYILFRGATVPSELT